MGLGCGNPQAIASLREGEVVLDLGSGGGFDCFLAAKAVGKTGRIIGVDMTPQMVSKARENAAKSGDDNVEFRLGEIEALPVADEVVDVVMSNCVINLSPEKPKVFKEVFRILRHGGRLAITDVVATVALPEDVRNNLELHAGCIAGAALVSELESMLEDAGFTNIQIKPIEASRALINQWFEGKSIGDFVVSGGRAGEGRDGKYMQEGNDINMSLGEFKWTGVYDGEKFSLDTGGKPNYPGFYKEEIKRITLLGDGEDLEWVMTKKGLAIKTPKKQGKYAHTFKIERYHHPKLK